MSADSPAVILYDSSGIELSVKNGVATPANTSGLMVAGSDGTNSRYMVVDSSGRPIVVGAGTAGSPAGGVLSIQGVGSGTPVPISGSITATNASVGTLGSAIPASGTQVGASDGTNLQVPRVFDADSGGGTQYILGVNLRGSSSGGSVEVGTDSNPVKTDPTGTTTQPVGGVSSGSWDPATPATFFGLARGEKAPLLLGADGTLQTYGGVLTDAGSFRDDFTTLTTTLTGTVTFINGSDIITGSGCSFTTEVDRFSYIRLSSHTDAEYALVLNVIDDDNLILETNYTGANGSGTATQAKWFPITGTGGSLSVANSELLITSGTTSGQNTYVYHGADYAPLEALFRFKVSQRIANQTVKLGFYDNELSPSLQAAIELTGTNNAQITLCSRSSLSASDLETYTITLPFGLTTAAYINLVIDYLPNQIRYWYDPLDGSPRTFLGACRTHIPNPYLSLLSCIGIFNTGVPSSDTTLTVDMTYLSDYNFVNIKEESGIVNPQATCTTVAAAVADTTLLAANNSRDGAMIYNDSLSYCYVKFGTGASSTSFTVRLTPQSYYEVPYGYRGQINGYWSSAIGNARITELA